VTSQGVQSTDPPLSDPSIYRTSPATSISSLFTALFAPKKFFAASNYCLTVWFVFDHCKKKTLLGVDFAAPATVVERSDGGRRAWRRPSPTVCALTVPAVARRAAVVAGEGTAVTVQAPERLGGGVRSVAARRSPAVPKRGRAPSAGAVGAPWCTFLLHWLAASVN